MDDRLSGQLRFLLELDGAKQVLRQNPLADGSRRENTAEHMWHFALAALMLAEHAAEPVDAGRVVLMALLHDIVEIDAADTFLYDDAGTLDKAAREAAAADRIFGLLPPDQAASLRGLWEEFEARDTPEARYAAAIDRLLPVLLNYEAGGGAWVEHRITRQQAEARNAHVAEGAPALWTVIQRIFDDAHQRGLLA